MISVPSVLSVFHFSVNVRPYSVHLYLVSRLPVTLVVSVLAEPELVNSFKREGESQPAAQHVLGTTQAIRQQLRPAVWAGDS